MNETTHQLLNTDYTAEEDEKFRAWQASLKPSTIATPAVSTEPRFGKIMSRYTLPRSTTKRSR